MRGICDLNVDGTGSLLSLLDFEGNPLPLSQCLKCCALDPRAMEKDLPTIIRRNKPKTTLLYQSLDFSRSHDVFLSVAKLPPC
jgi:hypothetical protein